MDWASIASNAPPADGEIKALVDENGLTGLRFKLVWTDGKGSVAKKSKRATTTSAADKLKTSDRPLNSEEQRDIALSIKRGYKYLKLDPMSSPAKTQEAIRKAIDAIALGRKKVGKSETLDLAVNLGFLWGQTACDALGWQWCCLNVGGGRETYVIVAPNRSHMVSPMDFVLQQLRKRLPEENTNMLLFNMLLGNSFGSAKAKSYTQLG